MYLSMGSNSKHLTPQIVMYLNVHKNPLGTKTSNYDGISMGRSTCSLVQSARVSPEAIIHPYVI